MRARFTPPWETPEWSGASPQTRGGTDCHTSIIGTVASKSSRSHAHRVLLESARKISQMRSQGGPYRISEEGEALKFEWVDNRLAARENRSELEDLSSQRKKKKKGQHRRGQGTGAAGHKKKSPTSTKLCQCRGGIRPPRKRWESIAELVRRERQRIVTVWWTEGTRATKGGGARDRGTYQKRNQTSQLGRPISVLEREGPNC